jgi:E3 ubiquitin-protein ligase HERC2
MGSLLKKYCSLLCSHVSDVLPLATNLASYSSKHFAAVARIIKHDISGVLLPEMSVSLVLLQLHAPSILHASHCTSNLVSLMESLDAFNQLAPGLHREDIEDLAWPGVWGESLVTQMMLSSHGLIYFSKLHGPLQSEGY